MSNIFNDSTQFVSALNAEQLSGYDNSTPFRRGIGFSVQRPYPSTSRYKPPLKSNGDPDSVVLIAIAYEPEDRASGFPNRVPVRARVSCYSRYISEHFDYNFQDVENCPTQSSIEASKLTPKPVDLYTASGRYFFDHSKDKLVNSDGQDVAVIDLVNNLYEQHLATVDKLKGFIFRLQLSSLAKASNLCVPLAGFLEWMLKTLCGRTIEPQDIYKWFSGEYDLKDMKLLKTESIDAFGYKASKNVIGTYCALLLIMFIIFKLIGATPHWIKVLSENSVLSIATSILALAFLDHIFPLIMLRLIKWAHKLRWKLLDIGVKMK